MQHVKVRGAGEDSDGELKKRTNSRDDSYSLYGPDLTAGDNSGAYERRLADPRSVALQE